ncbi:thioredoxin family protein [Xenophilus arseniciresistens]|uniref:Thioredoxin family protein n=1 Tax=Xenophilus arseniciresistens TaxID=1283306 RepID=A0AAE3N3Z1_9BURK|nr:thioredoxin family protein [Xenophilus arseniciresistens]MDA7415090.1 thioredoxin family protein [Xenophilus arseniciresistens]
MNQPPSTDLQVICLCAEWCGTCRDYRTLFAQVAQEHAGAAFAWVDVEDHSELADDFDVETFPTLLVASGQGLHFLGPMLPHAQTLSRLLTALPAASPAPAEVAALLRAVREDPASFTLQPPVARD